MGEVQWTDCFLCGKRTNPKTAFHFKQGDSFAPELPCHSDCLHGHTVAHVAAEYHRAVADLATVGRARFPHFLEHLD